MIEAYKKRYRTLGLNIAYYRRQKGLTQEQLAEKAGINDRESAKQKLPGLVQV